MPYVDSYPNNVTPDAGDRVILIHTNGDGSTEIIRATIAQLTSGASIQNGVTAAVGGQGVATQLVGQICTVTGVPVGSGVILTALAGEKQQVFNRVGSGHAVEVFPIEGMAIENNGTNVAVTVADQDDATFTNNGTIFLVS